MTSGAVHTAFASWGVYSSSKAALEALVRSYAAEISTTEVAGTLPTADEVAAQLIEMCRPSFKDNGATYKYAPTGQFKFER